MLTPHELPAIQRALAAADLDGWLLFDFQRTNPIAMGMLGLKGFISRRIFVWIPRQGVPHALGHAIEPGPWHSWPAGWGKSTYSSWRTLESSVRDMVKGKRIAMEYSAGDAVPYLDRVPAGVIEMVRAAGATSITSSGELVTRFNASWMEHDIASHVRAAGVIARVAREAFAIAGERSRSAQPITEFELMTWMQGEFGKAGLSADHGPNVSAGANAANPHYEPSAEHPRPILEGEVLLIDLWAREEGGTYADQTWMATIGTPTLRLRRLAWTEQTRRD